ncbi:ATP synthase subunit b [Sulfurimicrobium lacus]|uniref:ATP synthase subunit b n=1 Tax=Sulfurimicrobium lacus TaxID=2715678 RepID=A0A6F8VDT6_9PROT|nr:F0F1 ATP synthase subunit delta [Sulfurimicrobium lacus]BCB27321.1 ATP synthase subunit b [Sulfurimicrobium lacus]
MEFDLTTFILEVINFLVLVWLLKRFFYRPVLGVIEKRQAETAKTIADAAAIRLEAEGLKSECLGRLAGVDQERAAARAELAEEIAAERVRRLATVEAEVNTDRQRRQMLEERERSEREAALEHEAVNIAVRFASRFLDRLAGPELEAKLVELALRELDAQVPEKLDALRDPRVSIKVVSAYPLDEAKRTAFTLALGRLAGRPLVPEFSEDAILKAGVCIMAGSWVLMANLRDELSFFSGSLDHGG